ncbi:MAG: hypothetical protein AAGC65_23835 [Mucilaginibacter sp.]|uniref:hypothetical protein n=1 Tax=Mucilaginibacter sp. TaxID=1882438 RepID=UPI0031A31F5B
MIIENISELKLLVNVFYALKFGIDDDELVRIFRSPSFSRIFNEAVIELTERYKTINTIDGNSASLDFWKLDHRKKEREKILKYLLEIDSWGDIDESVQVETVQILLSPFIYDKNDLQEIIAEVNKR